MPESLLIAQTDQTSRTRLQWIEQMVSLVRREVIRGVSDSALGCGKRR